MCSATNRDYPTGEGMNLYALTHTGRNRGQNTVIILLPQVKKGIVVFTNGENGDKLYERIISEYFDTGKEILERMR